MSPFRLVKSAPRYVPRLVKSLSRAYSNRSLPQTTSHSPCLSRSSTSRTRATFPTCHVHLFVCRDHHIPWSRLPNLLAAQAWALRRGLPEVLRGNAAQVPLSRPLFKIVTSPWTRRRSDAAGPPVLVGGRGKVSDRDHGRGGETLKRSRGGQVAVGDDGAVQFNNRCGVLSLRPAHTPLTHQRRHSA